MKLFIDGDAFPNLLKPIVLRAIEKQKIDTIVIANKKINIGTSNYIKYIIVELGADEADDKIVEMLKGKKVKDISEKECTKIMLNSMCETSTKGKSIYKLT